MIGVGICVDNTSSTVLKVGERYYLFKCFGDYVYASRFPRRGSHCGCFQKKRFELVKDDLPEEQWQQIDFFMLGAID